MINIAIIICDGAVASLNEMPALLLNVWSTCLHISKLCRNNLYYVCWGDAKCVIAHYVMSCVWLPTERDSDSVSQVLDAYMLSGWPQTCA